MCEKISSSNLNPTMFPEIPIPSAKCKVDFSNSFYTKFCKTANELGVSKQGLATFLILNRYDTMLPDIRNGNYAAIKKDLQVYTGATYTSEMEAFEFRVTPVVNEILKNLAKNLKMSKKKLLEQMLYKNTLFFDDIINEIHQQKNFCGIYKQFRRKQKREEAEKRREIIDTRANPNEEWKDIFQYYADLKLSCVGIKSNDFSKIATAYCLYYTFYNINDSLWAQVFEDVGLI